MSERYFETLIGQKRKGLTVNTRRVLPRVSTAGLYPERNRTGGGDTMYPRRRRIGVRMRMRPRYARSYTRTKTRRPTSGRGVTSQYDKKTIYVRSRMPYRKRRAWRSFIRKSNAVDEKSLGSNTVIRNTKTDKTHTLVAAQEKKQEVLPLALYSFQNTGADWLNDVNKITANDARIGKATKIIFTSGILDITMKCDVTQGNEASSISLEVDVYEITVNKTVDWDQGLSEMYGNADAITDKINAANTSVGLGERGATPWDVPVAISQNRIKIWKKTKFFLSNGQVATYQYRDPKRHEFSIAQQAVDVVTTSKNENIIGMTRYVLLISKVTPGVTYSDSNTGSVKLNVGVTRKYLYKVNDDSTDYDGIIA